MLLRIIFSVFLGAATSGAVPVPHLRGVVTRLTPEQIAAYKPYALFARAAYCPAHRTATWTCGAPCTDLAGFVPYKSGGDGIATPYWYVGYHPALHSIIVSNQGTDPSKFIPLLIDADFGLDELDTTLFPGVPSSVKTHSGRRYSREMRGSKLDWISWSTGFQKAQKRSAGAKLDAVEKAMSKHGTSLVTLTGHSLGGAISLIDALFLSINLPNAKVKVVAHGIPRVGNPEFAALVDSKVTLEPSFCFNKR
ncbi:hypothetical protein FRC10_011083 [Ceratobasidium sp. 414]|nr:hypothetical protein FRC10_011083 [Ceratobasidium sp. 414]